MSTLQHHTHLDPVPETLGWRRGCGGTAKVGIRSRDLAARGVGPYCGEKGRSAGWRGPRGRQEPARAGLCEVTASGGREAAGAAGRGVWRSLDKEMMKRERYIYQGGGDRA